MYDMRSLIAIIFIICVIPLQGQDLQSLRIENLLFDNGDMAADSAEAFTFTKYPTHFQYLDMMKSLSSRFPDICRLDTIGFSVLGRPILVLKISDTVNDTEGEARFFYTSTMHGDEILGYVLLLRFANFLLHDYGNDTEVSRLLDSLEIWINPLSNPDGAFKYNDSTLVNAWRYNIQGSGDPYNLNRNFPDPYSGEPDDTTGRLAETKSMMTFMQEHRFNMSANIHSGAEVVNYPWDYKPERHPDDAWYSFISREYADEAKAVEPAYMSEFTDGITNGFDWYRILGGRQDYVNYYLGGREVTLELSNIKLLDSDSLDTFWDYNKRSLINYMSQATYGIHGRITGKPSGQPVKAKIVVLEHDDENSWISSDSLTGRFYRYLKEGNYDLVISAEGYKNDTLPGINVTDYQVTWLDINLDSVVDPVGINSDQVWNPGIVQLYPNPASDFLSLKVIGTVEDIINCRIYSIDGMYISDMSGKGENDFYADISALRPGIYLIKINAEHFISTHKFIKQ